ncbi:Glyoxylate reductase [Paraburkholderia piptadeniae]|uniref:Glyoxylate reductase n=1 Tax=Paraburkholderia piptadeniae TaxID=1701573 RepID=A0A1N7SPE1_9BURK|nr:2-hydroxyacid dehydrogenase [Paraburkholderia piptadeniae]SIT49294.1 Glyoxylate reductase [Paraburkholderia piptadeniae]
MRKLTQPETGRPAVVLVVPIFPTAMDVLETEFTVHRLWEETDRDAALVRWADEAQALVTFANGPVDAALMAALPNVKIIATMTVGVDHIDLEAARKRGIQVTHTPDVLTEAVADLAMALVLSVARQIVVADRFVRTGEWSRRVLPPVRSVSGSHVGVVGLGRIGLAFARRAAAFDMRVSYYGPRRKPDVGYRYYDNLRALARDVDYLVITAPGGPQTDRMIDGAVLADLGPNGALINVGRGSIVDEPALVAALVNGTLGAAGLDVYANEPHIPEELCALENVVLLPHIASATLETRAAMGELVVNNLRAWFAGRPVLTPVI